MKNINSLKSAGFIFLLFIIVAAVWSLASMGLKNKRDLKGKVVNINSITAILYVNNVNKTVEYYKTNLGFKLTTTFPEEGEGEYEFALVEKNNSQLMFQKFSVGDSLFITSSRNYNSVSLYIEITQVEYLYNKLKESVEVVSPLEERFYGSKEFTIRDMNNFIITFAEEVTN